MAKNTVIVSILGDTRDLQSKLDGSSSGFGKWAAAGLAAAAIVGAAVVGAAVKGVKSASELEQNMGAMESVFKSNADQMTSWAQNAAGAVGLAKSEYAGLATVLGSQLKNMGVAQQQLGSQTNDLIGLGADLAAQFGGSTADAVGALSSLLRGERDPIERYGVSINQAAIDAKLAELGLKGLTGEAAKNAQLTATLALLYAQTADAQGAFSRESTTLAGAQQRLAAGTENLFAVFGTSLLPAVTAVTAALGWLINMISTSDWFAAMTAGISSASNAFADFVFGILNGTGSLDFSALFAGILPAVIAGIQNAANWIANGGTNTIVEALSAGRAALLNAALQVFAAIAAALPQILPELLQSVLIMLQDVIMLLLGAIPQILATATAMFMSLVQAVVATIPDLVNTLVNILPLLVESLLGMLPGILAAAIALFTALVQAIPLIVPPLIAGIITLLPQLVQSILSMLPGILQGAIDLFTALIMAIPVILPVLVRAIADLLPVLLRTVVSMLPQLLQAAVQLFTGLVSAIPKVIPQLVPALIGLIPVIVGTLIGLIPELVKAGVNLIGGLVKGIMQAAGSVGKALLDIAKSAIGGFLGFLGIHSPSRLFAGYGKYTVQGLVQGLTRNAGLVDGAMAGLSARVSDGFDPQLTAPEISDAFRSYSSASSARAGNTYNIDVSTLNATAETGRIIVESIRDYEDAGGRL